ncbi:hypothetical protein [Apilactobacillus xinyiensis]|uniref:hypothetical protein n=1 Tax=Apilactobacillus xinyiensis TaxID=2841032 RepID=UPI00200DC335|nr:hypothetical protein [Apilactobacillus xinyiensis]MCL0330825.1 hypothetical protein [Apilactobacillus xinyiensis]
MIADILNVIGIVFIFIFIFTFITTLIDFLFTKQFKSKKAITSGVFLILGAVLIMFVQMNGSYVKKETVLYSDANNALPLSVTLVANSKINYDYDKDCLTKGLHKGKVFFKINNLKINKFTNLKITQKYRDNFLVPTIREDNFKIIRK